MISLSHDEYAPAHFNIHVIVHIIYPHPQLSEEYPVLSVSLVNEGSSRSHVDYVIVKTARVRTRILYTLYKIILWFSRNF